jgi:PHP family Zn ribbon phosphoesterase
LITSIGSEFYILLHASIEDILKQVSDPLIAKAIENMRNGKVRVTPGYDGIFGVIEAVGDSKNGKPRQTSLF